MRTYWLSLLTATALISCTAACNPEGRPDPAAADASVALPCTDSDGDGFGPGCPAGLDCDDTDPASTNECRSCTTPDTNCACDGSVAETPCYLDPVDVGGRAMCSAGTRFCRDAAWTACLGLATYELPGTLNGGTAAALITGPVVCNPCNPSCYSTTDTPGPADVGTGGVIYTPVPGGLTLPSTVGMATLPDTDGDGVPDAYDSQPTNPAVTGFEGGFFHVLPLGSTALDPLILSVRVRTADIYFLMDTTGSMGGEINTLKATLNTTVIPAIRTTIPDAWFGVGSHDDYPFSAYGGPTAWYGDVVYRNLLDITDPAPAAGATAITTAVNALALHWGNDWPESQAQALWSIATGSALGTYSAAHSCAIPGRFGYPCFRAGTVPIVILLTDAPYHNGPQTGFDYNPADFGTTVYTYYPMPATVPVSGIPFPAPPSAAVAVSASAGVFRPLPASTPMVRIPYLAPAAAAVAVPMTVGYWRTVPAIPSVVPGVPYLAGPTAAVPAPMGVGAWRTVPATPTAVPPGASYLAPGAAPVPAALGPGAWRPTPATPTAVPGVPYVAPPAVAVPAIYGPGSWRATPPGPTAVPGVPYVAPAVAPVPATIGAGAWRPTPAVPTAVPGVPYVAPPAVAVPATYAPGSWRPTPATPTAVPGVPYVAPAVAPVPATLGAGAWRPTPATPTAVPGVPYVAPAGAVIPAPMSTGYWRPSPAVPTAVPGVPYVAPAAAPVPATLGAGSWRPTPATPTAVPGVPYLVPAAAPVPATVSAGAWRPTPATPTAVPGVPYLAPAAGAIAVPLGAAGFRALPASVAAGSPETYATARSAGNVTNASASFSGVTCGMANNYGGTCGAGTAGDAVFSFTLTAATQVLINTAGSSFDTSMSLRNSVGAEIACNDDAVGLQSQLNVSLGTGTYYVIVDGYSSGCGNYVFNIAPWGPAGYRNETYATAQPMGDVTTTSAAYTGSTTAMTNDYSGTCGAGTVGDAVFSFTLAATTRVVLDTVGSGFDTSMSLRNSAYGEIACNDDAVGLGGLASLIDTTLAAGTYYVIVDGWSTSVGAYRLNVRPYLMGPATNETYATAYALGDATNTSTSFSGNTCGMVNHYSGTCGAGTNGDAVFSFTLAATTRVLIDTVGSAFDTSMSVRNSATAEVACNDDAVGAASQLDLTLGAGTYYVIVDGWSSNCGAYELNVAPYIPGAPLNETYATAQAMGDVTSTSASISGNTAAVLGVSSAMVNHYSGGACAAGTAGDAVVSFSLSAPTRVVVNTVGSAFATSVSLRNAATAELFCAMSGTTSQIDQTLAAGTYYVIVDGSGTSSGAYQVNVAPYVMGAPANETYATSLALGDVTTTPKSYSGNTCVMRDDYAGGCGAGTGGDAVFSFTLSATTRVLLDTVGSTFDTSMSVWTGPGIPPGAIACNDDAVGAASQLDLTLAAGTYYVVVDGFVSGCGAYELNVTSFVPGTPVNETYATAQSMGNVTSASATVIGTTAPMVNHYSGGACGAGTAGDAVVSFSLTAPTRVLINSNGSAFNTSLSLHSFVAPYAELACATSGTTSPIDTTLPAGTYYVVVDGSGTSSGAYQVNVSPYLVGPAANETYATAYALGDATTTPKSVSGNTCGMASNYAGTCTAGTAGDAVFTFTLAASMRVLLDTVGSTFATSMSLWSGTAAAPVYVNCNALGATSTLDLTLAAGTYFVVIDGAGAACGNYELNVSTFVPPVPLNETYATAASMGNVTTTSATVTGTTTGMTSDYAGTCLAGTAGDAVVSFVLTASTHVLINTVGSAFNTSISLRNAATAEVACNDDAVGLQSQIDTTLAAGTYYVIVDGNGTATGTYQVSVSPYLVGAAANETYPTAYVLGDATTTTKSVSGNTCGMVNNYSGTCTAGTAGDAVFTFTLATPTRVMLDTIGSAFNTSLSLWSGAAAAPTYVNCSAVGATSPLDVTLAAGTYFAVVDGAGAACGNYELNVATYIPGAPVNETYASAQSMGNVTSVSASVTGNTAGVVGASAAMIDHYSGGACGAGLAGDAVVSFRLAAPTRVLINSNGSAFNTSLSLHSFVAPYAELACATSGTTSPIDTTLAAGDYYVVVDGSGTSSGAYQVNVSPYLIGPAANETYATAYVLGDATTTPKSVSGNTCGMASNYTGTCTAGTAGDAVFTFTLAASMRVQLDTVGSTFATSMSLWSGTAAAPVYVNCNALGATSTLDLTLAAGTYFVVIDGAGAACGNYELNVSTFIPGVPANETYATAQSMGNVTTTSATITGTTAPMLNHYSGTCAAGTAGDAVVSFVLTASTHVLVSTVGSAFNTSISLRNAATAEVACNDDAVGVQSQIDTTLAAGTYYVIVDGNGTATGNYQVSVSPYLIGAAANETYPTAYVLGDATTTTKSVSGNTCGMVNNYSGTCTAGAAGDAVFTFTLATPTRVMLDTIGSAFNTSLSLWSGAAAAPTYVNCSAVGATSPLDVTLAAGTYFVVVDGAGAACGNYELNVATYIPGAPVNETYASAQAMGNVTTASASVTGNTAGVVGASAAMIDHYSGGACGAGLAGDAVVSFRLAAPTRVLINSNGSAFNTSLSLHSFAAPYAELACATSGTTSPIDTTLAAGDYYVVVDGSGTSSGAYQVNVSPYLIGPAANETYPTAYALGDATTTPKSVSGNTCGMANNYTGTCTAGTAGDAVFTFTLSASMRVQLDTIGSAFNTSMSLWSGTAAAPVYVNCNALGATSTLDLTLAAGTYFVVVDGAGAACGNYELNVATFIAGVPLNETYATAQSMGNVTTTSATITGTTAPMLNHYSGTCAAGTAGDAVVSFVLTASTHVLVSTVGSAFNTSISLRNAATAEVACNDDAVGVQSQIDTTLAAGTYYVIVDGNGTATGNYQVSVSPYLVGAAANETYPTAYVLGDATTTTMSVSGNTCGMVNNYAGTCSAGTAGDAVFTFTLAAASRVMLDTIGSAFATSISLWSGTAAAPVYASCSALGATSPLDVTLAAGTYFVVVDGAGAACGNYELNVATYIPGAPLNETYATAQSMGNVTTTSASASGNTGGVGGVSGPMVNHYSGGACGAGLAGDAVVSFSLTAPTRVLIDSVGSAFNTSLSVHSSLSPYAELACATSGTTSAIDTTLAAGTYYVVVDGSGTSSGAYRVNVTPYLIGASLNETYATAFGLGDVTTTPKSYSGNTCGMVNNYSGTCTAGAAGDAVFTFTLSSPTRVQLDTIGSAFNTSMSLWSGTAAAPVYVNCSALGATSPLDVTLAAGTYFVIVDGAGPACGNYELNVNTFIPPVPLNETYATAQSLGNVTTTSASATGNTGGVGGVSGPMVNHYSGGACGAGTAGDAVVSFSLSASTHVLIDTVGSAFATSLSLHSFASPYAELACATTGTTSPIDTTLAAGSYYVVLDGSGTATGAYQVNVTPYLTGPAANETYATALALGDVTTTPKSYAGNTCGMLSNYSGSCASGAAGDAVFTFTLTSPMRVLLDTVGSAFNTSMSLWTGSVAAPTAVACNDDAVGTASQIDTTLPAGTYFVTVDGNGTACGAYELNLTTYVPGVALNETYATALAIGELTTRTTGASYTGSTATMTSDYTGYGTCAAGTGGDAVFSFTLAASTRVVLDTIGSAFSTSLALYNGPVGAPVYTQCNTAGAASRIDTTLAAGTYFVIVDGNGTANGAYTLNVTPYLIGGAANETFASAYAVGDITTSSASFSGESCSMTDNYAGTCGAGTGDDAVYSFTLSATTRVLINTVGSAFNTSISLWSGAAGSPAYVNCNALGATSALDLTLGAGTYFVIVDGAGAACGNYVVNFTTYVPGSPLNETYTSAQAIGELTTRTAGATYTGNTATMVDHYSGTCAAGTAGDAVFSFTLASSTRVVVDTIGSAFNTSLSLRNSATLELGCNDDAVGTASRIDQTLAAGTYYVIVDGNGTARGAYTLNVTPYLPGVAANETFATAYPVGDITARSAAFSGTTAGLVNNYSGTCGSGTGGDAVFSFTLTAVRHIVLDTSGSAYDTSLSLWSGAAPTYVSCNDNGLGAQSRIETNLAPGTYYVVVDGFNTAQGPYMLNLRVSSSTSGGFAPPAWSDTLAQLNSRGIKVIVVETSGGDASAISDANALCTATGSVSSTGVPLRYSISSSGAGLDSTIATAVADVANYSRMDITARTNDNTATVGFDERTFVSSIAALSYPVGRCTGITGGVQFNQCLPGTTVNFQVNFTGVVAATSVTQRFDFTIDVLGNGSNILSTIPVTIIIPAIAPAFPVSGSYTRDFDATTSCAGTEVARWRALSWSATYPVGTSITWAASGAATLAGLAAATSVSFSSPTAPSPQDVGDRLVAAGLPATLPYMRITATLNSNAARSAAPTLSSFNVIFDCVPGT